MTLIAVIVVFLLEQLRPAPSVRLRALIVAWGEFAERHFNAGEPVHAKAVWAIAVLFPAALVAAIHLLLGWASSLLALLFAVLVLYGSFGFRQFSHFFTDIHLALRMGEGERARELFSRWRRAAPADNRALLRLTIEEGLLGAYRYVFAPLFWFLILGPAGALLYRLAVILAEHWRDEAHGPLAHLATAALAVLDWLPVRVAALTFAIVGDFEDAIYCWRTQAAQWPDAPSGILLSAGAGALGVRLGQPVEIGGAVEHRPELGLGDEADIEHLQSAIGLVWRAVVLMLSLLGLLTFAAWLG